MNHKVRLTTCDSGDWNVLEVDGEFFAAGHTFSEYDWLDLLNLVGIQAIRIQISDKEMEEFY